MPKYGIATLLEVHAPTFEFSPDHAPLHLTHIDSFVVELEPAALEQKLRDCVRNTVAFSTTALKDELYGPQKDIPVTELTPTDELKTLQSSLVSMLTAEGAIFKNPQFVGEHFSPHVSIYGDRRVQLGQSVLINKLSIGAKVSDEDGANHRILTTINLGYD